MLTRRQLELLTFIGDYIRENKQSPMLEEMREAVGGRSKSAIAFLLDRLQERGFIRRIRRIARNVVILKMPAPPPPRATLFTISANAVPLSIYDGADIFTVAA